MEQLLEDYKRKLETIKQMIADDNGESESILERLKTKLGMIRSFIVDIERAMADANTGNIGLHLQNFNASLLSDVEYWKIRCELMEAIEKESRCDPYITNGQIKAYNAYHKFISHYGNGR